jgi:hypothetical protein
MKFAATLFVTTILAAAPAWAQTTTSPTTASPAPATTAPAPATSPHKLATRTAAVPPGQTMEVLVDKRIADLHKQLHITSAESSQWDQFAQVMRDNAKEVDQSYKDRADKLDTMSAVDNMQSFAQIEQLRAQQMQKLVPAFQTLYASLSDEQKQDADALFRNQAAKSQAHRQAAAAKSATTK